MIEPLGGMLINNTVTSDITCPFQCQFGRRKVSGLDSGQLVYPEWSMLGIRPDRRLHVRGQARQNGPGQPLFLWTTTVSTLSHILPQIIMANVTGHPILNNCISIPL